MNAQWPLTKSMRVNMLGFTLLELLVVMAIVLILASVLSTAISTAKERAKRIACNNNVRQITLGCLLYADDDRKGYYTSTLSDADNNLNFLYSGYVSAGKTFICPSTRNQVSLRDTFFNTQTRQVEIMDLFDFASNRLARGMSYEVFGFMNCTTPSKEEFLIEKELGITRGVKKSIISVENYVHSHEALGLKGARPGPSQTWLLTDGDSGNNGTNNFPDRDDNHGASGANVGFCDGHVAWVRQNRFVFEYELSQDEGRSKP